MKPLTKLFIILLSTCLSWIVIEIAADLNTMHFFNWWSLITFMIIGAVFIVYGVFYKLTIIK